MLCFLAQRAQHNMLLFQAEENRSAEEQKASPPDSCVCVCACTSVSLLQMVADTRKTKVAVELCTQESSYDCADGK